MYCSVFSKMASATVVANSPIPQQIHTSKTKLNHHNTASIAHSTQNAKLHAVFTQSFKPARSSDHSQSLGYATGPEEQLPRAGFIQPFGATIVVEDSSFRILAHSENARDMLAIHAPLGADVRSLFTHSSALLLEQAFTCTDTLTTTNPILIHSRTSAKPFYGILHRINAGIVIDLETVRSEDTNIVESKLQSLPGGDVKLLCDTVVESIKEMTGYDRVMVYKFHEDDHGEVVSESKRPDLEAYIGLHYPASDIPEASRVLFKKNRVRMIVDCHASAVRVVQDEALVEPLCLVGSTLRAPHGCHVQYMANMGSIATLVMAVFANGNGTKLWGLVICHHSSPRCIPFPLRRACESLVKDFELRLNTELQTEKRILGELSLRIRESSSASASALCFR